MFIIAILRFVAVAFRLASVASNALDGINGSPFQRDLFDPRKA